MLGILLTILKIIGIILLVILGLILLILIIVLCVPVRYTVGGSGGYHKESEESVKYEGCAKVTWLLHMISVRADFSKAGFGALAKLFGIPVVRLGIYEKPEKDKKKKKKKRKDDTSDSSIEEIPAEPSETAGITEISNETASESESSGDDIVSNDNNSEQTALDETSPEEFDLLDEELPNDKISKEKTPLPEKLKNTFEKLTTKAASIKEKVEDISEKGGKVTEFLDDEKNKAGIAYILKCVLRLIKHYLPRDPQGEIAFAFEDPSLMGKALMVFGMLYPATCEHLKVTPDFDDTLYVEGDLNLKGHIRLVHVLFLGLKILINGKSRGLILNALKLKKNL